jgi:hypothetical protein
LRERLGRLLALVGEHLSLLRKRLQQLALFLFERGNALRCG